MENKYNLVTPGKNRDNNADIAQQNKKTASYQDFEVCMWTSNFNYGKGYSNKQQYASTYYDNQGYTQNYLHIHTFTEN